MTWSVLEEMRDHYHRDIKKLRALSTRDLESAPALKSSKNSGEYSSIHRQIIFTATTLPSRGRQSVQAQLMRWVPKNTLFFDTDHTHQVISLAQMKFIDIRDSEEQKDGINTKFEQLTADLLSLRDSLSSDDSLQMEKSQLPKVLVFANTVTSAEEIFSHLERIAEERADIWWKGKLGKLHKQSSASAEEKEKTLRDFRTGSR